MINLRFKNIPHHHFLWAIQQNILERLLQIYFNINNMICDPKSIVENYNYLVDKAIDINLGILAIAVAAALFTPAIVERRRAKAKYHSEQVLKFLKTTVLKYLTVQHDRIDSSSSQSERFEQRAIYSVKHFLETQIIWNEDGSTWDVETYMQDNKWDEFVKILRGRLDHFSNFPQFNKVPENVSLMLQAFCRHIERDLQTIEGQAISVSYWKGCVSNIKQNLVVPVYSIGFMLITMFLSSSIPPATCVVLFPFVLILTGWSAFLIYQFTQGILQGIEYL